MMHKRKNLIWIIVDSIRAYRTGADERDRLDIMDEFALESVEFLNAFTSAPSSILSGAAMFTGMPSCFVARHFDDWQFDPKVIISLQEVLSSAGYTNYAIHNSKEDREVMQDLLHPISYRYFPKGISHGKWWTNHQVNLILENVLNAGVQGPSFFLLWYDCRDDPLVSDTVKEALQLFKNFGLYDDSVIVITSDHGYPDPRSGITQARGRMNMRHDMVVTDDNIRVPLFIKYPGCEPHKVHHLVGLIDLFPTLLHLLEVETDDPRMKNVQGLDLSKLLEDGSAQWESRVIRIDTRLTLAPGRITVLRTDKYKYVFYHDENAEGLFSLENDPLELDDLLEHPSPEIEKLRVDFREQFEMSQDQLHHFHIEELETAFERNVQRIKEIKIKRLLLLSVAPRVFLYIITKSFRRNFPGISIDILSLEDRELPPESGALFDQVLIAEKIDTQAAKRELKSGKISRYDVSLVIREKSDVDFDDPAIYNIAKILGNKVLMVTYNMKFYSRFLSQWLWPVRKYRRNWEFYKNEPGLLFNDILKLIKNGVIYLILKKRVETPDMLKEKKIRDKGLLTAKERMATKGQ